MAKAPFWSGHGNTKPRKGVVRLGVIYLNVYRLWVARAPPDRLPHTPIGPCRRFKHQVKWAVLHAADVHNPCGFACWSVQAVCQIVGTPAIIVIDEIDEIEDAFPGKTRTFIEQHKSVQLLASTNYIKKLKPALQSRMRCVEVKKPLPMDWVPRAQAILMAEGANVTTAIVQQLMANFTGDARDFIDYLEEQVHTARQFVPVASSQPRTVARILNQASGGTP